MRGKSHSEVPPNLLHLNVRIGTAGSPTRGLFRGEAAGPNPPAAFLSSLPWWRLRLRPAPFLLVKQAARLTTTMNESFSDQLKQIAGEIAGAQHSKIERLKKDVQEAAERKVQAEVELRMVESAISQASHYDPGSNGDYLCPHCWIERDTRAELKSVPTDSSRVDLFRCRICGVEIPLEI